MQLGLKGTEHGAFVERDHGDLGTYEAFSIHPTVDASDTTRSRYPASFNVHSMANAREQKKTFTFETPAMARG